MATRRRRRVLIIVASALTAVLGAVGLLAVLNRPLSSDEFDAAITAELEKTVAENDSLSSALLTIYSGEHDDLRQYAVGTTHLGGDEPATVDSPYHSASVGKTMLTTVFGQLADEGVLSLDDPIATWLPAATLDGLFTRPEEVTIAHLLAHTSGAADYFEGPVTSVPTMLDLITTEPDTVFTPQSLLAFSRDHQVPVGDPGEKFLYSDTGYVVAGLALEQITQKPYAEVLQERIFEPLGMHDSYLMSSFGAESGILGITADGVDLSDRTALSVDWAGGGVVTTMSDLLAFTRALERGELVSQTVRDRMTDFSSEMETGIHYGMGTMEFRFSELSFLLFSMTDARGAVGASGTYALYDPTSDTYFIANYGSLDFAQKAIEKLVEVRLLLDRLQR